MKNRKRIVRDVFDCHTCRFSVHVVIGKTDWHKMAAHTVVLSLLLAIFKRLFFLTNTVFFVVDDLVVFVFVPVIVLCVGYFVLICFDCCCYVVVVCFALLWFGLVCFALLCFALLCFALLCFALVWFPHIPFQCFLTSVSL